MKYLKTYNENQLIKDHLKDNGKTLDLIDLNLTELPELPDSLIDLYCDNNQLPYKNLEEYKIWYAETYPEKIEAKKYNLL